MKYESNALSNRQVYIDWLRILLITSVFLFHTGMIFVPWEWHVKNDVLYSGVLTYLMSFLHSWRMPLLFMISGAGTFYAMRNLSPAGYIKERSKRLLIPLGAGIFLLVPVQVYIEKIENYSSLAGFYPHMFEGIYPAGNFSWHHLWFIAYLFTISLIITPFLNLIKGQKFQQLTSRIATFLSKPYALNLVILPLLLSQIILRMFFEQETHDLVNDWATFTYYLIFFVAGLTLLPAKDVSEAAVRQRMFYLAETIVLTAVMFMIPSLLKNERAGEIVHDVCEIAIGWTCSVAVIGYAKKHLNIDTPLRKTGNEAIYPFYLLHQPLIVVTGFLVTRAEMADGLKAMVIIASSLLAFIFLYRYLIRPFRIARALFGMKTGRKKSDADQPSVMKQESQRA